VLPTLNAEDWTALHNVVIDAWEQQATPEETARKIEEEVPHAAPLAPLFGQSSATLAAWLVIFLMIAFYLYPHDAQQPTPAPAPPAITQAQVKRVVEEVVEAVLSREAPTPPPAPVPPRDGAHPTEPHESPQH
jgi:hypothetical protein